MPAFDEAIALAEKLLEMKSDPHDARWQIVYDLAKRGALWRSELGLVERYVEGDVALHAHISLLHYFGGMPERIDLCAVLHGGSDGNTRNSTVGDGSFACAHLDYSGCKVSVFVNVRENREQSKQVMHSIGSVIRLQALDECERLVGKPQPFWQQCAFPNGATMDWALAPEGKLTAVDLLGREWDVMPFDKLEEEVIESGWQW